MKRVHVQLTGVGLTIAAGLAVVGYFSTLLLWQDLRPWRHYNVKFQRTAGLRKDDDVFVHGLIVGRVSTVKLAGDHQLVDVEVDPAVTLHRSGTTVKIESVDAFGTVALFCDPGDPNSVAYGPEDTVEGTYRGGFIAGPSDEAGGATRVTEALHEVEQATGDLLRADSGRIGRLLDDPDRAVELRDGLARLRETAQDAKESIRGLEASDEGSGALVSADVAARIADAAHRARESLEMTHEGLRGAAEGDVGFAGRLAGDPSVGDSARDSVHWLSRVLEGYRTGDVVFGPALLSHAPEPGERLADALESLARDTERAHAGEGSLGDLLGAGTGTQTSEVLANLGRSLENARTADASSGALFSPSAAGSREVLDQTSRLEDTLREMRGALVRLRADASPNTFQGAVFSVF